MSTHFYIDGIAHDFPEGEAAVLRTNGGAAGVQYILLLPVGPDAPLRDTSGNQVTLRGIMAAMPPGAGGLAARLGAEAAERADWRDLPIPHADEVAAYHLPAADAWRATLVGRGGGGAAERQIRARARMRHWLGFDIDAPA